MVPIAGTLQKDAMSAPTVRDRLITEIQRIPDTHLEEVFNLLHFFRIGLETSQRPPADNLLSFAGTWQDMDDGIFEEFQEEIAARRRQAFRGRRADDANHD
jgi:hypothetical protein